MIACCCERSPDTVLALKAPVLGGYAPVPGVNAPVPGPVKAPVLPGVVLSIGVSAWASAAIGVRPGRTTTVDQCSPETLSAGTMPARTNDDLPTPEGPTMPSRGASRSRVTAAATSRDRPRKRCASDSWNDLRPA